jgi:hypothetical protein
MVCKRRDLHAAGRNGPKESCVRKPRQFADARTEIMKALAVLRDMHRR